ILVLSGISSASVLMISANAGMFSWVITRLGTAVSIANSVLEFTSNPVVILLMINVFLLVAGCLMDAVSLYYILVPILLPIVTSIGVDPIVFGVIMTVNMAIGTTTPPVGINLPVACQIGQVSLAAISKELVPF